MAAKTPPNDIDAEIGVLGAMLFDSQALRYGASALAETDFYLPTHGAIFKAMVDLTEKSSSVDIVTVKNELVNTGNLDRIGGFGYLAEIAAGHITSANIKEHVGIVSEKAIRRRYIQKATELLALAYDGKYVDLLANGEKRITAASNGDVYRLPTVLEEALDDVRKHMQNGKKFTGVTTGFLDLDLMLGGLQDTDLIILAARPSMGKTAFALNILQHISKTFAKENKVALFFSLEMSRKKIALRTFSSESRIKAERFRFGTLDKSDMDSLNFFSPIFGDEMNETYICDEMGTTTQDMFSKCYGLKGRTEREIGLIMIDYLQLIKPVKETMNRNADLTIISRELKRLAKEFNCPVVALSQLSRNTETRPGKRPALSDLRESGAIEQDADVVAFLYREDYYNAEKAGDSFCETEVIIAKHRDGSLGTVRLFFEKEYVTFHSIERK